MRIGDRSAFSRPTLPSKPALAPAAGKPVMASDAFTADAGTINVVTFNVAGGASGFKHEEALTDAPLFQKLITGAADAPIVACQETTPALVKKLVAESKNGNFEVIWPGQTWVPKGVPTSTLMQGNMLLVPRRYQVKSSEAHTFSGRASQLLRALKGVLFNRGKVNDLLLALQNRGYVAAELKDTRTGRQFSVLATHVAYQDEVRRAAAPQLRDALMKARAKGPTVLMGDFNVPTLQATGKQHQDVVDFWQALAPAGLKDMGPTGQAGASFWKNGQDIDAVLATGFRSVSSEMLTGAKMAIPGHPDARDVSDHYAEADTLKFE